MTKQGLLKKQETADRRCRPKFLKYGNSNAKYHCNKEKAYTYLQVSEYSLVVFGIAKNGLMDGIGNSTDRQIIQIQIFKFCLPMTVASIS